MDNGFEITQHLNWRGDTMVGDIIGKISLGMAKEREAEVLRHFETDFTELREFLDAKANGLEMAPVVRCKDCKHYDGQECYHPRSDMGDSLSVDPMDFCSYGERKDNV